MIAMRAFTGKRPSGMPSITCKISRAIGEIVRFFSAVFGFYALQ